MTEFDRGPMTSGVRVIEDRRTHIERISPMILGATYAEGIGAAAVFHGRDADPVEEAGVRLASAIALETDDPVIESDHD